MIIQDGSITDANGSISFGTNDLTTDGRLTAGAATLASGTAIGNITVSDGSITSGSNAISFGDENLVTTGTLNAGVATLASTSKIGDLTLSNGSIVDENEAISFGNNDLSTTGTLSAGVATFESGTQVGNVVISNGSINAINDKINFGNDTLITNGPIIAGASTLASGTTISNLTVSDGSITSGSNAISFGGNNLSTTGTLNAGVSALASGTAIGNLTVSDGSITSGSNAISFGDNNLSTTGIISASSFTGDGSALTGVVASSTGTLAGATPIILEGESEDDFETTLAVEDPSESDKTITLPNVTGTIITTGNDSSIDEVGTVTSGVWQATLVADTYVADDLTISGGDVTNSTIEGSTIDNTIIGGTTPSEVVVTTLTANTGIEPGESDGASLGTSSAEFSDVFLADGAKINLGNNQDVTLTHIKDVGVKLNGSNQLQFGDSETKISQSADGVLDLESDEEVEINGTTIDINGDVDISGSLTTGSTIVTNGSLMPASSDGAGLGSTSAEFSDVFLADGAEISLGDNQEVTLTHIEDEGLRLNSLNQLQFGDSGTKIYQSADGVLDLVSDNEVEINGTTIDLNGDAMLDNATVDFVRIDGTYVGHVDDTDLMNLANGTLTVSGTLAATTFSGDGSNLTGISASSVKADDISQGDAAVSISTSSGAINLNPASGSPVLIDNTINFDGSLIGHTDDTDLMTLANGSVTFTGSTVIPVADVNGGAIDGVTLVQTVR